MKRQFMVRILRSCDEEYADTVVDAESKDEAKTISLRVVKANPDLYFGEPDEPAYYVDPTNDVEELDGGEYESARDPKPSSNMLVTDEMVEAARLTLSRICGFAITSATVRRTLESALSAATEGR